MKKSLRATATILLAVLAGIFLSNILQTSEKNQTIVPESGLKVGMKAPDFELVTLEGETVSLSDFKGKKVFINFWATWCEPCRDEMPAMEDFYQKHNGEVEVLAVNALNTEIEGKRKVENFTEEYKLSFPVLLDREGSVQEIYQITHMPTTVFIGTDGFIQETLHRGPMDTAFMDEVRKELN